MTTRRTFLTATGALALSACATNPFRTGHPPIVFVHGNGDSASIWQSTLWRFESNDWPRNRMHAIDLPYPLARDVDANAQPGRTSTAEHMAFLKAEVERVLQATGAPQVVLMANSRGGYAVRNYIQNGGGAAVVALVGVSGGWASLYAAAVLDDTPRPPLDPKRLVAGLTSGELAWTTTTSYVAAGLALGLLVLVFLGILLVPTGQRLFATGIGYFQVHRSTGKLVMRLASPAGFHAVRRSIRLPSLTRLRGFAQDRGVGWGVLVANCLAQALIVVGVLASLYAGFLNPQYRVTASQLSAVVNGFATILLFALIDPQLSVMTDDVVEGRIDEARFRRTIVWISISRLVGTLLAQALFVPAAHSVAWIANYV